MSEIILPFSTSLLVKCVAFLSSESVSTRTAGNGLNNSILKSFLIRVVFLCLEEKMEKTVNGRVLLVRL